MFIEGSFMLLFFKDHLFRFKIQLNKFVKLFHFPNGIYLFKINNKALEQSLNLI